MTIAIEMNQFIFCVCVILCLSSYSAMSQTFNESSVAKIHEQWMFQYERSYANDIEKEKHLKIFIENLEYIEKFNNNANKNYKLGLNQFSDLTMDEFIASYTGLKISRQTSFSSKVATLNLTDEIPTTIDWREKGAVTSVKQQLECGKLFFVVLNRVCSAIGVTVAATARV
ncbi:putative ananain protein [Lupinus albus]|uniref:Putative ananain protein n=1 Tax=Lupinus albus TaxID=3870 RepID=A0A6A4PT03_LUPAL|nr:putative ananain protein [Lupinus albus]